MCRMPAFAAYKCAFIPINIIGRDRGCSRSELNEGKFMRALWYLLGIVSFFFISIGASASETAAKGSYRKGSVLEEMLKTHDAPFVLYPYETNYLVYTVTSDVNKEAISSYSWGNDAKKNEMKFQISLGFPLWRDILGENTLLGASYTQGSWWQAFNHDQSAPFRETNYEPQVFLGWVTNYEFMGWTIKDVELGANHQSNGRSEPTSRSWNRLYVRMMAQNGNWVAELKPWYRLNEKAHKDDNPEITKYLGYYRARLGYNWGKSVLSLEGHYNWNSGFGNAELGWSYPINSSVRIYTQLFSGYGESMIDYDFKQTRFGVGLMLNDIM